MDTTPTRSIKYKRRGLSLLSVLGGLLLLLPLLVPPVALASSTNPTKSLAGLSPQGVLDLAGVSVVRLEVSYSLTRPATVVQCTALGTLIASWPATNATEQNNWVLTDGSVLDPTTGAGSCVPGGSLTMIQILASNEFTNHQSAFTVLDQLTCQNALCTDQPPGSSGPIAETISRPVHGGVLLSFHSNVSHTLPFLTVAPSFTSASSDGIELANAGAGGVWPATPRITSSAPPLESFLDPKLGNTTAGNSPPTPGVTPLSNEPGMPLVDSNGQVTGMQISGTGNQFTLADIQSLEQSQSELTPPILPTHLAQNLLSAKWETGIRQYEQGDYPQAVQTLTSIERDNLSFQAPRVFAQMAAAKIPNGTNGTPTPPQGNTQGSSFLGIPISWVLIVGLVAGVMVLVLLFVLVSLVFGRRRAVRKQDKQEMERFKAEEVEAHRIAEREARRIAETGSQRPYAQPAGAGTTAPLRSPKSDLRCPNCHEAIEETDTYCPNCRYLLSPTASGLHRFAAPPPVAPQVQSQPQGAYAVPPVAPPQAQPQPQGAYAAPPPPSAQSISEYPTVEMSPRNGSQESERTLPYNVQQLQGRNLSLAVGYESDPGIKRKHKPNEDSLFALQGARTHDSQPEQFGLFVVADGMGGHANGQDASRLAIQNMIDFMLPRISTVTVTDDDAYLKLLEEGVQHANQAVHQRNMEERADMGTTMTAALVIGATAYVANVGDSRTYLYREPQGLSKITHDHSVVASLVDAGIIKPDDVYTHPKRNQIYRSLGEKQVVEVDSFKVPLQVGDKLLLCSDGLWDMVRDPEIQRVISSPAPDPTQTGKDLIDAALKGGGEDNVSVIVVSITEASGHTGMTGIQLLAKPESVTVPDLPPM